MRDPADSVQLTLPRSVVAELPSLSAELTQRMHALLERNTDGQLSETERAELEMLVRMAQLADIFAMAARTALAA
jgi:hypothetical protein